MKYLIILLFVSVSCFGQKDTSNIGIGLTSGTTSGSFYTQKDSTWYVSRTDTIKTDFAIVVDSNNFVKKVSCPFLLHKYDEFHHSDFGLWVNSFESNRNDTFMLNNKPIEVLLYKPKGEPILVGNSR